METDRTQAVEAFLAAVRDDHDEAARRLLEADPAIGSVNIFAAAAAGLPDVVDRLIHENASRATATDGPDDWPPLAYACRSPLHRGSAAQARDLRQVATRLLDVGASANAFSTWTASPGKKLPIPVLYHACMSDHVDLVTVLLERGAVANDGESIYHAAQCNRQACLEAMLAHGADLSSRQEPYGNTPLYFLVGHHDDEGGTTPWFKGMVWLLEHGANPNITSYKSAETPLHGVAASQPKLATVRQLLAHGADVNLPRGDGRMPYAIAVRHGNWAIADLLRDYGAQTDVLQPIEAFLGACLAADGARARQVLSSQPGLIASMTEEDRSALADAVRQNKAEAIRLMVDLGFDLAWQAHDGGTPLHWAAWLGRLNLVKLLVDLGAPLDVRDLQFGSSPLGWAAHGSGCHAGHDEAYCAIVDALLGAGADRAASINTVGEPPEALANPRVATHLRTRLAAHESNRV